MLANKTLFENQGAVQTWPVGSSLLAPALGECPFVWLFTIDQGPDAVTYTDKL